jgi:hypothetical protein
MIFGAIFGVVYLVNMEDDAETWQAVLYINNWTGCTLDINVYVFASDTVLYSITLDDGANVTLTVTWQDVDETVAILHCIGEDINSWLAYELAPGEWESVILL